MICPYCKEEVHDGAVKCKHCKSQLTDSPASNIQSNQPTQQSPPIIQVQTQNGYSEQICIKCKGTGEISACIKIGQLLLAITILLLLVGIFEVSWGYAGIVGGIALFVQWEYLDKCEVCKGNGKVDLSEMKGKDRSY